MRSVVLFLLAAAAAARAEALSVRVEQPRQAAVLRGGSTAVIAWSGEDLDAGVEEWEAFLSVDGGRYYAARITPHLDASIRQFRWTVPNVTTHDARILLRFGNERDERVVETPLTISIEASAQPVVVEVPSHVAGESARPGEPPVTSWIESGRDGSNAVPLQSSSDAVQAIPARSYEHSESPLPAQTLVVAQPVASREIVIARAAPPRPVDNVAADTLLAICRLNI